MTVKIDRRKLRTRRLLKESLLALILERGYDTLTIQDITDYADLRRATFYLHYKDKDELLLTVLNELFDELAASLEPQIKDDSLAGKTDPAIFTAMFRYVAHNAALYRALFNSSAGTTIIRHIRSYLANLVIEKSSSMTDSRPVPVVLLAHYMAGTELSLIQWWLEHDMPYSPEAMALMTHRLLLHGALGVQTTDDEG